MKMPYPLSVKFSTNSIQLCTMFWCMNLLLHFITFTNTLQIKSSVVRISSGDIRGVVSLDKLRVFYSYMGIPYARVEQRFQAAKPVLPWQGVLEANDGNTKCVQSNMIQEFMPKNPIMSFIAKPVVGTEDCLKLNVYTNASPGSKEESLRPVMVFIHGGGFKEGSGGPLIYGPEYFLRQDVVLVTINYRLGVLGFLCLGTKEAPGNVGLKDQVEALKWVKQNIKAFGGDPENVTIFGESAGSASVMYHILSPVSKNLFKRAIMESGSATAPWGIQFEPVKIASKLAKQMGYDIEDPSKIYEIFMNKTAEELVGTQIPRKEGDIVESENVFVPCAEKNLTSDAFITDTPYNIITKGLYTKIPMIIGYNNAEGYYFLGKENETTIANIDHYFENSLPRNFEYHLKEEKFKTTKDLRELYFGNETINRNNLVKYEGEHGIIFPVTDAISLFAQNNDHPIYPYKFCYDGFLNLMKFESGFFGYPGASHVDELFYMFKPQFVTILDIVENNIISRMTKMWTNFAKFGNPTPEETLLLPVKWEPLNKENPLLFVIDKQFSTEKLWQSETLQFWNRTYAKYRRTVS